MDDKDNHTRALLERYDAMKKEFQQLERELSRECTEYGRRRGVWGYRPDHLRIALANEREQNTKANLRRS